MTPPRPSITIDARKRGVAVSHWSVLQLCFYNLIFKRCQFFKLWRSKSSMLNGMDHLDHSILSRIFDSFFFGVGLRNLFFYSRKCFRRLTHANTRKILAALPPLELTFRGAEYLSYDLSQRGIEPILSENDEISLFFKTRKSSGLLFHTGKKAFKFETSSC